MKLAKLENEVSAAIQEEQAGLTLIMDGNFVGTYLRSPAIVITGLGLWRNSEGIKANGSRGCSK